LLSPRLARADEPSKVEDPKVAPKVEPPKVEPSKVEVNLIPIAGGDTDVGIGIGEVGDIARVLPGGFRYIWKVESGAFITGKIQDGVFRIPFQDYYFIYSVPNLTASQRLRIDIRPAFTNETTLKFYGIGNATPFPSTVPIGQTEYERMHPTLSAEARYRIYEAFYVKVGSVYTQNWLTVSPNSLLAQAQTSPDPVVRSMIGSFAPHGVELLEAEVQYDSRDNDVVTRRGMFLSACLRYSPRITSELPYAYERATLKAQFYGTPVRRWLTLSFRLVGDTLLGSPPFYELARFDETPAVGGGKALRGVPAQRYYGKLKAFGNVELRTELFTFRALGKPVIFGLVPFFDAGRLWADSNAQPGLDGRGVGLKYGTGAGVRLQSGASFVIRADVAWSPDATPISGYFSAGQMF
jgi:outer membrane protein assembly factor BamA